MTMKSAQLTVSMQGFRIYCLVGLAYIREISVAWRFSLHRLKPQGYIVIDFWHLRGMAPFPPKSPLSNAVSLPNLTVFGQRFAEISPNKVDGSF